MSDPKEQAEKLWALIRFQSPSEAIAEVLAYRDEVLEEANILVKALESIAEDKQEHADLDKMLEPDPYWGALRRQTAEEALEAYRALEQGKGEKCTS